MVQKIGLTWYIWYKSWYNEREVIRINSSDYFKRVYPCMGKQKNQGVFVTNCFITAGSTFFSLPKNKLKQTSDNLEYQRMIYKGSRSITVEMKSSFPDPFPIDALAAFFSDNLKEEKLRDAMTAFAIPISVTPDRAILSKSLAAQFQLLIQSDDDDADDIVAVKYQQLLSEPAPEPIQR